MVDSSACNLAAAFAVYAAVRVADFFAAAIDAGLPAMFDIAVSRATGRHCSLVTKSEAQPRSSSEQRAIRFFSSFRSFSCLTSYDGFPHLLLADI